ncbi:MAG: hypothetical protein NTW65_12035 [Deltaproteobacteria bacterium]|nr:hypothetical protein [Deltaproteobacteria bacterium]
MKKNIFAKLILMIFVLTTIACSGLRFSESAPEAKGFHPQNVAIFPVEVWNNEETKAVKVVMEQVIAGSLVEKKWFAKVIDKESLDNQLLADEELNKAMKEYLSKLQEVKFSDPDLSQKIGELAKVDAFLLVSIDEWNYVVEKDENVAKVGMTMKLYEASTGKLMWKAGQDIKKNYLVIKPDLTKIARDVIRQMIDYMPH